MKACLFISFIIFFISNSFIFGQIWVDSYYKDSGINVNGHYKTEKNDIIWDNYSTKGNINPYTLKEGTVNPYKNFFENNNKVKDYSIYNDVKVDSYIKTDGTIINSYYRTKPNNTLLDNYSTKGNINPHTFKIGKIKPFKFK